MFAVLDKTEIIIYKSNLFFRFFGKFSYILWEIFWAKLTSLIVGQLRPSHGDKFRRPWAGQDLHE